MPTFSTVTLNPALDKTMFFRDEFLMGGLNRAVCSVTEAGGKGINVSRVLKRFGADAVCFGFVGGRSGRTLCDLLDLADIPYRFTHTLAETRTCVKLRDDYSVTEANEAGGPVSEGEKRNLLRSLDRSAGDIVCLSGSLPHGLPPETLPELIALLKKKGRVVAVDTSGEALAAALDASPDLIKPNEHELARLIGRRAETETELVDACTAIYEKHQTAVLCTLGGEGAVYVGKDGIFSVPASPVRQVKNTVCAGDTFLAAFLFAYYGEGEHRSDPVYALSLASSAAGAKTEKEGTEIPTREELGQYLDCVPVRKL